MKLKTGSFAALSFIIWMLTIVFPSCEQGPGNTDGLRTVCFDTEILPLIQSSCATSNCHDAAAEGGLRLDSYEGILEGIRSGDPQQSTLYKTIVSSGEDHMPPDTLMSMEHRVLLKVWIEQGAAKIICELAPDSIINDTVTPPYSNPSVCFERDILPVMQSSCGTTGCHDPISMVEEFKFYKLPGDR